MNRYQILIEYVGTNYNGWQVQRKGKTIQGKIQNTISKIFKEKINICLLYTSPSPRDGRISRMPSSA